jgi:hypothetical protein
MIDRLPLIKCVALTKKVKLSFDLSLGSIIGVETGLHSPASDHSVDIFCRGNRGQVSAGEDQNFFLSKIL